MANDGRRRNRVQRKVLLPRYTPLVGTTPFYSAPMDVRAFASAVLTAWQGTGIGATPATAEFVVQQSPDLETWLDGTPFSTTGPDEEVTRTEDFHFGWARLKVTVTGADPVVTSWLTGEFVPRDTDGESGAMVPAVGS